MAEQPIHRTVNLLPESARVPEGTDRAAVETALFDDPTSLSALPGSFAVVGRRGSDIRLARSLDRPLRYFLAKEGAGPYLVVAERIDEIRDHLVTEGHEWQFHPTYTRMVPAHHVTVLALIGCPDPGPRYERFFTPRKDVFSDDLDEIGERYITALKAEISAWLSTVPVTEPIGVLFSGGIDSGSVLLATYRALLDSGQTAQRLKAFTLTVDGGGSDLEQAREFLRANDLAYLGEELNVAATTIDPLAAVDVIEDYKPLDVECAAVNLAALGAIRERYPDWRYLLDGDGGDENLKDYPIEENRELTIRSVVGNPLLYHEGWGVDALKHSLTYSGGLSRGYVRTYAPQRRYGFAGFSPYTRPLGHRGRRGHSLRRSHPRKCRSALRPEGRRRSRRRRAGPRHADAGLSEVPIPGRRRFGIDLRRSFRRGPRDLQSTPAGALRRPAGVSAPLGPAEVRALRPAHAPPGIDRPIGVTQEIERSETGPESAATLFLAGAQCSWSCVFCDLWRFTTDAKTPGGAIPDQIAHALTGLATPPRILKLYNASNFFDERAVPAGDDDAILKLVSGFSRVVVESHPHRLGQRAIRYARAIDGRLEVAMGLETANAFAHPRLGKGTTPEDFRTAADWLHHHDIDVRLFALVGCPFVPREHQVANVVETVRFAHEVGARVISLIPVRQGNGALELLARRDDFEPPSLALLEDCLDAAITKCPETMINADLWDLAPLSTCPACLEDRRQRLDDTNLDGRRRPPVVCASCTDALH